MAFTKKDRENGMQQAIEERNKICDGILNRYENIKLKKITTEAEKDILFWERKEKIYWAEKRNEHKQNKANNKQVKKRKQYDLFQNT